MRKWIFVSITTLVLMFPIINALALDETPFTTGEQKRKAAAEIREMVREIKFDFKSLADQTIKIHFMLNSAEEVIILRTSNEEVDKLIKYHLNYKSLKTRGLEVNKVYILPINFIETKN